MAEKKDKGKSKEKKEGKGKTPKAETPQPVGKQIVAKVGKEVKASKEMTSENAEPKLVVAKPSKPSLSDRAGVAQRKAEERANALAAKRKESLEKAQAEAAARKLAWEKHKEEAKAKAEARAAQLRETAEARKSGREAAKRESAELKAERAQKAKSERDAKLAEREKLRMEAQALRAKSNVKPAKSVPTKSTAKAAAPKATTSSAPEATGLDLGVPEPVLKAWGKAVKIASKSTQQQTLSYLKPVGGGDARANSKLESLRKKIAKDLEDAICVVATKLMDSNLRGPAKDLKLNEKTSKLQFSFPEFGLTQELKRGLQAPMRDLASQLGGKDGAVVHFPSLSTPMMLQFFGDLETGQQFDGSLTFSFLPENPSASRFDYHLTFVGKGKKSKEPSIVVAFSHDLGLTNGKGTLSVGVFVTIPAPEEPKN